MAIALLVWEFGVGTAARREREKRQRNDLIMDAALEVFAEKGLKNATMDDVAERAELSKGTIYLYFKSKEHLFYAIDMKAAVLLRERFSEASRSEDTGIAKVRAIGRAYYRFCFDFPSYFKAMSYVDSMDPQTFKAIAEEMMPQDQQGEKHLALAILSEAIETGHADGTISRDLDPGLTAILLWAASDGVIAMLKNRGEYFELLGVPMDALYTAKETLVQRGLSPASPLQETEKP